MHILIFGTGAIGAYLGSRLAQAGHAVTFLARPAWAEALRRDGLHVEHRGRRQTLTTPDLLTELPQAFDLGPDGVILLTVKAFDADEAARTIARSVHGGAAVVCLCNGIGVEDALASVLGADRIVPATLTTAVQTLAPGTIRVERERGIGLAAGPIGDALARTMIAAGIDARTFADPAAMKWSKVPTNIVANASSAILGWTAAQTMAHPGVIRLEIEALRETFLAMRRLGHHPVNLPGVPVRWLALAIFLPPRLTGRLLQRLVARGRGDKLPSFHYDVGRGRSEVRWLNGAVVNAGERIGLSTPANRVLQRNLLDLVEGRADPSEWRGRPERLLVHARREGVPGLTPGL